MFSILLIFAYLMADVAPWGHGGDGAGDPPIPPGGFRGTHETDAVPPKRVRGKAKNEKLRRLVKAGGPVSLTFDRQVTYTPVGKTRDMFSREVGLYMWRSIPFDKIGWDNVEQHYKDALMNHLRENFNFDEVERVIEAKNLTGGIRAVLMKRYSDRKYDAKKLFKSKGGYNDLESARAFHPKDMPYDNWLRTIEGFREAKYIKRSEANTLVREKQQFPYRGGTSSYGSTAYKNDMDWVPTYAKTHMDNQGNWVDPVAEQNYRNIQHATSEWSGEGPPIAPYQEALGERRGWYRGMGPKPSSNTSSHSSSNMSSSQARTQEPFSEDFVNSLFQTPSFLNQLNNYLASQGKGKGKSKDYDSDNLFDNESDDEPNNNDDDE
ncbi:hypothetical protein HanHA300_Chr10g0367761 [Helianthus annuus]|nr:hypothetical protein HanHA300_Chr10g0367761 [Helianthus annuus]